MLDRNSTSSRRISPVTDARTDILSIDFPSVDPAHRRAVDQKERDAPHAPSSDVFAATVSRSATGAGHPRLGPRSTYRSPRRWARVVMFATSEPASGSVSAKVATRSPRSAGTR